DFNLPENLEYVNNIQILESGEIVVTGYPKMDESQKPEDMYGKDQFYYITKDSGANWEEKTIKLPAAAEGMIRTWSNAIIKADGSFLVSSEVMSKEDMDKMSNMNPEEQNPEGVKPEDGQVGLDEEPKEDLFPSSKTEMYSVDKNGESKKIEVKDDKLQIYGDMKSDNSGNIYVNDFEGAKIKQLDGNTLEVKKEFVPNIEGDMKNIVSWFISGKSIYMSSFEEMYEFDLESGEEKGKVKVDKAIMNGGNGIYPGKEEGIAYALTQQGVNKFKIGSDKSTRIIDGSLCTIGNPDFYPDKFIVKSDEEFIVTFSGMGKGGTTAKFYKYDESATEKRDKEITIFTMYDSQVVRQGANKYQKENEDVKVNVEIGMDFTATEPQNPDDIIKKLNTELLSGKGPDIIVLNELPVKTYIEKGVLEDVSDIVVNNDELFKGIIESSKSKDGKIQAIPLSFSIAAIAGKNIGAVNNIKTLSEQIGDIASKTEGTVLDIYKPEELVYSLYATSGSGFVNEDKSLNKEKLKEFLESCKKIYDATKDKHSEANKAEYDEFISMMKENGGISPESKESIDEMYGKYGTNKMKLLAKNPIGISINGIMGLDDYFMTEGMKDNNGINYNLWLGNNEQVGIVNESIGINSKGKNKEIAKDFLKTVLTTEGQSSQFGWGFPINKNALISAYNETDAEERTMGTSIGTGEESIEIKYKKVSQEKFDAFIALVDGKGATFTPDIEVLRKSIDEFAAYISGSKSIDDAISAIEGKLKIYLSE
ncbi:MAG: ABC transporter substrate-binding protein, partial [Clostridium sp.]